MSIQRIDPAARYSEATVHQGTVYLSGQVPNDGVADDIRAQTADVLAAIDRLLERAGSNRQHLLSATVFLRDMGDYTGMNEVWDAWVPHGNAPCRATVQARLASSEWRIEILVTAAVAA